MRHSIGSKIIAVALAIGCFSILSGCYVGPREPRHERREERREEHREEHREK
jgi:hypothetical protein